MYECMYIISVVVLQIYFSCAQIYNNQQVYEVQIQVPRCSSILKAGLHECQKLRPLHLGRCTGKHTDRSPKATHFNVCLGKILLLDRCFHPSSNISSSIILIYTLFYYYYYYHHFYFYIFKGCIHQITTKLLI